MSKINEKGSPRYLFTLHYLSSQYKYSNVNFKNSLRQVRFLNDSSNSNDPFNDPLLKDYENLSIEELRKESM
jgi:hypothetical protein